MKPCRMMALASLTMARIDGRLIVRVPGWRISLVRIALWPVSLGYKAGVVPEAWLDRIIASAAHWSVRKAKIVRVEWSDDDKTA